MQIHKEDFLNHCNAGLTLFGLDTNGDIDWVGKSHNWTAYEWLVDGVSPLAVHDYLVAQV